MTAFQLTVGQRRLAAAVVLCVVAAVVLLHHGRGAPATSGGSLRVAPLRATTTAAPSGPAQPLVVDVVGAVHRPGLYHLPRGARVADAVRRAGGLTRRAERAAVNLAAPLADGEQVLIAARGSPAGVLPGASSGGAGAAGPTAPVSLSTATAEQLDALPGVGPVTAQKIIAYREQHGPFTSVDALDAIPGIGPARIADLRGLVVP